jgi:hypothetical protein
MRRRISILISSLTLISSQGRDSLIQPVSESNPAVVPSRLLVPFLGDPVAFIRIVAFCLTANPA